jgi:hypothetical protein
MANELDKAGRDLSNRTRGFISGIKALLSNDDTSTDVLVERIRSRIGRAISPPHAIHVIADSSGWVALDGPVLADEVQSLLKEVNAVPGVTDAVHADPTSISCLQGGVPRQRRSEFTQQNWTPALRITAAAAGSGLIYYWARSNGMIRWGTGLAGAALLARSIANKKFRQILGTRPGPSSSIRPSISMRKSKKFFRIGQITRTFRVSCRI